MNTPTPECERCGDPIWPERDGQKYCSARCREAAKKRRQRFRLRRGESLGPQGTRVTDESLTELYERARRPDHWDGIEAGHVDPDLLEFSDHDFGLDDDQVPAVDAETARYHALFQEDADQRTPRETWRKWRAYGRRHGTEHPEQTADRIERHQAAETAKIDRIDQGTAGRVQDRFDSRTATNLARNANASRRLNARYTDQPPPVSSPVFDFRAESIDGGPYRSGRPAGQRSRNADYAWRMTDGFVN